MKFINITLLFSFILLLFTACRKDELVINEDNVTPPDVTVKYEITLSGEVFDLNSEPLAGATVHLGNQVVQTDQNGVFQLTGLANAEKAVLKIEKAGYFNSYPVFYPQQNVGRHIRAEMMERPQVGTVDASTKIVSIDNHQIDFTNATFKDGSGNPYTGAVNVYATYLDPTAENLPYFMPGDLVGINTEEEQQLLKSFGMLNVELEDNSGNEVTMEGTAEMTMMIPNTLLNQAPANIPLWYFDTTTGNWMEEGTATLNGNVYVGTVAHFTFWNCDAPFDLVRITGSILSSYENEIAHVEIIRPNGDIGTAFLDNSNWFTGFVPQDESLTLKVVDHCENVLYVLNIPPLSQGTDLGEIDVTLYPTQTLTISGNAINCDLNPVNDGYVIVSDGEGMVEYIELDNNGSYNLTIAWCSTEDINVMAFDRSSNKVSEIAVFAYNQTIESSNMLTCEEVAIGIYIAGPVVNKFIAATSALEESQSAPGFAYTYTCIDDQGNSNKLIYDMTLITWTGDPANPQLAMSYVKNVVGTPTQLDWSYDVNNLVYEIFNSTSGSLIDLKYENVTVTVTDANGAATSYDNHTFRVVQKIE